MTQTFSEYLTQNKPQYSFLIPKIAEVIGKTPEWTDLTKSNLYHIKNKWLEQMAANSVKTYMAVLQSVMNQVSEEIDLPRNFSDGMKVKKQASTAVYLTEKEVERFRNVTVKTPNERFVHAMFLLQYDTGCRYSDAMRLTESNISQGQLRYVSQKTSIAVTLPAKTELVKLIRELNELKAPSKPTYIKTLKNLCFRAGIRSEVCIFKGGKTLNGCKYQFVGSHTARRSFATNLLLRGADIYTISKLMGHSSVEMTTRYICAQVVLNDKLKNFFE